MDGTMAEYTVRVRREGNGNKLQVVIHGDDVVAEGDLQPIGLKGHPSYYELYDYTLQAVLHS